MGDPKDWFGKRYENGETYWNVIGYIDRPALLLQDPITGETNTVVIGCPNHDAMKEISDAMVIVRLEARIRPKDDFEKAIGL